MWQGLPGFSEQWERGPKPGRRTLYVSETKSLITKYADLLIIFPSRAGWVSTFYFTSQGIFRENVVLNMQL